MKSFKWMGLVLAVLCTASCGQQPVAETEPIPEDTRVGDFNFIAQNTRTPEHTVISTSAFTYETDIYGAPIIETTAASSDSVIITNSDGSISQDIDTTTAITLPPAPEEVSTFVDLSTDVSLRIGQNVYVSAPKSIFESCCDIDTFMDSKRVAYNLVNDEDKASINVQKQVYSDGTCVHMESSVMYIDAYGIGFWAKNVESSLESAKSPTISMFNLGKLKGNLSTVNLSYKKLGNLISSAETDYYYKAIYDIADLKNNESISGRAVIIYDKETGSTSTCVVYINRTYFENTTIDVDFLASSVRYSVVAPDNLATIQ